MKLTRKKILLPILILVIALIYASCGSTPSTNVFRKSQPRSESSTASALRESEEPSAVKARADVGTEEGADSAQLAKTTAQPTQVNRKIVRSVVFELQTKDYNNAVKAIQNMTEDFDGYFSSSKVVGLNQKNSADYYSASRTASFVIKIPAENLNDFLAELQEDELFFVFDQSESAEDITQSYYDNEAAVKALEERVTRLEALLALQRDLKTMLEIEKEISETITEINILHSRQEVMKSWVSMATVTITLEEILEYKQQTPTKPVSFGTRVSFAFTSAVVELVESVQGVFLYLVENVFGLIFFALLVLLLVFFLRRNIKKAKINRSKEKEKYEQELLAYNQYMQSAGTASFQPPNAQQPLITAVPPSEEKSDVAPKDTK